MSFPFMTTRSSSSKISGSIVLFSENSYLAYNIPLTSPKTARVFFFGVLHLKELFHEQARSERFKVSKMLFRSKMQEGTSPVQYALKMHGYIVRLDQLGFGMDNELSIDLILAGLRDSFA